jgi:transcriptional regulator with XRE-family HTH domain
MTISQTQLKKEISQPEIKKFWLGYFQEEFRQAIHQQILELFSNSGISRSELAKKIGRRPEQVTRWLSSPGNIEADTISDMGIGLGVVPRLTFEQVDSLFFSSLPNQGNPVSDTVAALLGRDRNATNPSIVNYNPSSMDRARESRITDPMRSNQAIEQPSVKKFLSGNQRTQNTERV